MFEDIAGAVKQDVAQLENQAAKELIGLKKIVGPGVITGAADDDPSGIATYSTIGAQFGLRLNWLVMVTLPIMIAIQDIAARIGLVTGKGLAGVIKQHYSKTLLYSAVGLLVAANTINIAADLAAMAEATKLMVGGISFVWAVVWSAIMGLLVVYVSYRRYAGILKFLTLSLLAYVATAFIVDLDWGEVLRALFTVDLTFDRLFLIAVVAFLGTTISPYLFFWQASEEVEERPAGLIVTKSKIFKQRADTVLGMIFSQLVTFFIIVATAATLHRAGITSINSAQDAALALRPLAGDFAFGLFALGIVGTGLLGIPVLAGSAAYAVAEAAGWQEGLNLKFNQAKGFYAVILISLVVGLAMNILGIDPIKALMYAAIVNGLVAPVLIALMVKIASNQKIMGSKRNSWITITIGWITCGVMASAGLGLIWAMIFD